MFFKKKSKELEIYTCVQGEVLPIENVPDPVFAEKILGDGIAINPSNGEIISPIDGEITMIQDSLHAIGIKVDDDIEILIHIGLETVELNGEGFTKKVNVNDRVKKGQPIVCFDKKLIEDKGYNTITMMLVINNDNIIGIEKEFKIDKPLLKVQYK
ncbi:PTS sugar transporter subunit IIA [Peptoclostridium sp. AF21-18]|uniref:PTS sugar transporter subunit IIA n=1 Tax=Peptoclostridium sp. AF21-18 TaxID=2292243 RepID=UPI002570794B|nr:PTS glucose transporter subunit IIA [Peptoclostridium sp. AF21-18]